MLLFVIVVSELLSDQGTRNRARSITKALGARDLSPPARLLATENFFAFFNLQAKSHLSVNPDMTIHPAFPSVSDGYDLYVGFIFKISK
jgi:hypothetical protein